MPVPTPARAGFVVSKVWWGLRQVGPLQVARGLCRLLVITVRRPRTVVTRGRRTGLRIAFRYPEQLIPTLVVFGDLLEPELALLEEHLDPHGIAVDVGASIGTWTMMAARTGARVHACEPDPGGLEVLRDNARANGLDHRVTTHCLAVGEHTGRANLQPSSRSYLNGIQEVVDDEEEGLPLTTLDAFLDSEGLDRVDVLKVNTAGHEAQVLAGALPALRAGRVRMALMLDGTALREALATSGLSNYDVCLYDGARGTLVPVDLAAGTLATRPSPMNHYLVLVRH